MRSQMSLGVKLLLSVGALATVIVAFSVASLYENHNLTGEMNRVVNITGQKRFLAQRISVATSNMLAASQQLLLGSILQRPEMVSQSKRVFESASNDYRAALTQLRALSIGSDSGNLGQLEPALNNAVSANNAILAAIEKQQFDQVQKTFEETEYPQLREVGRQAEQLVDLENGQMQQVLSGANRTSSTAMWVTAVLIALAIGACLLVVLVIGHVNRSLRRIAAEVGEGARRVSQAAIQVCSASGTLAQGAAQQAAALQETSASMEEMSSITHKNEDHSRSTAQLMDTTAGSVACAEATIREMSDAMQEISASGAKITKVVQLINDISFQTRILSLNAAVEAARAGAAGAGFAVVAEQVGNLAEECAKAAQETGAMIDDTVRRVAEGADRLNRAAQAVHEVVTNSSQVKRLVDEVHTGSREQVSGIDQITRAVVQMEQTTQQTAASAEESASAGEELKAHAEALDELVKNMRVLVDGTK